MPWTKKKDNLKKRVSNKNQWKKKNESVIITMVKKDWHESQPRQNGQQKWKSLCSLLPAAVSWYWRDRREDSVNWSSKEMMRIWYKEVILTSTKKFRGGRREKIMKIWYKITSLAYEKCEWLDSGDRSSSTHISIVFESDDDT